MIVTGINVSGTFLHRSKAMGCVAEKSEFDSKTEQTFSLQHAAGASEARHLPLSSAQFMNVWSHNSTHRMSALRPAFIKLRNIIFVALFNVTSAHLSPVNFLSTKVVTRLKIFI
jgi:hypothetical protein